LIELAAINWFQSRQGIGSKNARQLIGSNSGKIQWRPAPPSFVLIVKPTIDDDLLPKTSAKTNYKKRASSTPAAAETCASGDFQFPLFV